MYLEELIIQTKLTPLRSTKRMLQRPRVTERLLEAIDYKLTILQAGAGYGKSTALAALADEVYSVVWYQIDPEDTDPLIFLLYLLHGFYRTFESFTETPFTLLESRESSPSVPLKRIIDALVNEIAVNVPESVLLVLDDAHLLNRVPESKLLLQRLIEHAPDNLHILTSTRYPLELETLSKLRVKGHVLDIGEEELAFTSNEIQTLFRKQFDIVLDDEQISVIATETEGWAITLQLLWRGIPGNEPHNLPLALKRFKGIQGDLFTFLAEEVLAQQEPDLQAFLLSTSCLRQLDPDICNCIRGADDSSSILVHLLEMGLFISEVSVDVTRYHALFRQFLYHRLSEDKQIETHRRAALCFEAQADYEEAVYHHLKATDYQQAAVIIQRIGRTMLVAGRLETLARWIDSIPPSMLVAHPALLIYLGDIARLHSRFDEALQWYQQAEDLCRTSHDLQGVGRALRGQARVYIDTVNPSEAEEPLREALRLSDGQANRDTHANLLDLLAENQLNRGHTIEAQKLRTEARELRDEGPDESMLDFRVMIRTGKFDQASKRLKERIDVEKLEPVLRPRAHRETLLLLSLIQSFQGESAGAYANAVKGTERGEELNSPFITAVGYMRQGHAWLISDDENRYEKARKCFEQTLELSDRLQVSRLKVEAYWGLCRTYGYQGRVTHASESALQGLDITEKAGDEWVAAQIRLSLGAGYVLSNQIDEALLWLSHADTGFHECGDSFGQAAVRMWRCIIWHNQDDHVRLERDLADLLQITEIYKYDYLLTEHTLAGPPEPRSLIPLLIHARSCNIRTDYIEHLLDQMGMQHLAYHPGYQLRIQTLGAFRMWRGNNEIDGSEWQREKARQVFHLLIATRKTLIDREKLWGILWPVLAPDAAARSFKVALNALYRALEPLRERGAPSAYIIRNGSLYGLRSEADLWLDANTFEEAVTAGNDAYDNDPAASVEHYKQALALYKGDFLEEFIYEDWTRTERVRLQQLCLRAADRLARVQGELQTWEDALETCEFILTIDDCWEHAYRLIMICYAQMGNRTQALRAYQHAVEHLKRELDAAPSPETTVLFHAIQAATYP